MGEKALADPCDLENGGIVMRKCTSRALVIPSEARDLVVAHDNCLARDGCSAQRPRSLASLGMTVHRSPIPHPQSPVPHDNHHRILPDVKLRTSGLQFGGRDSWSISRRRRHADSVAWRTVRGFARRRANLREIQARTPREARRDHEAPLRTGDQARLVFRHNANCYFHRRR